MNKLILLAFTIFGVFTAEAQDAKKALKNASKDLARYFQDPTNNANKLSEALAAVTTAFQDETVKADPASWITKGEIYNTIGNNEATQKQIDPNFELKHPNAGIEAAEAFKMAMGMAAGKKGIIKDAVNGLLEVFLILRSQIMLRLLKILILI
jgi:hypothetical protein